jgi:hypothetical protein
MTDPVVEIPEKTILGTTKKMLGISEDDTSFDTDIIAALNLTFMTLNQIGVGPLTSFTIVEGTETLDDFLEDALVLYGGLDTYLYLKVKMVFDPPVTSFSLEANQRLVEEIENRFCLQSQIILKGESTL